MEVTNAAPNRWCVSPGSKKSFKTLAPEGVYNSRVKSAYDSVIKDTQCHIRARLNPAGCDPQLCVVWLKRLSAS